MSDLNNIKIFNAIVGKIFADLYSNFPVSSSIDLARYVTELTSEDDFDGAWDVSLIASSSLDWLIKSDYIWLLECQAINEPNMRGVLTPKALEVLKVVPGSLINGKTFGDKLVDVSKGAFSAGLNEIVTHK